VTLIEINTFDGYQPSDIKIPPRTKDPFRRAKQIFERIERTPESKNPLPINRYLEALAEDTSSNVEDVLFIADYLFAYPDIGLAIIGVIDDQEFPLPLSLLVEQAEDILIQKSEEKPEDDDPQCVMRQMNAVYKAIDFLKLIDSPNAADFICSGYYSYNLSEEDGDIFWNDVVPNVATALRLYEIVKERNYLLLVNHPDENIRRMYGADEKVHRNEPPPTSILHIPPNKS
jgi:hypothetical protein